jgi:mediator of RNA polymerase II transcription subunit 14
MNEPNGGAFHAPPPVPSPPLNGADASLQPEHELPHVYDGQIPLGDLLSRVMQAIYAELSEMAETYVHQYHRYMLDRRRLACQICQTLRGNVRLPSGSLKRKSRWSNSTQWQSGPAMQTLSKSAWYANSSRHLPASNVSQNITAFLLNQNRQFGDSIEALNEARKSLDPARFSNSFISL